MNENSQWNKRINDIKEVLLNYNLEDLIKSISCAYLWLPNIASPHKFLYLFCVLTSLKPESYKQQKRINTYEDFLSFLRELYPLLPSFGMLEDYVPEVEWGDVKFHFLKNDYKIFYGNELETVVDFLEMFQIIHCSIDERYIKNIKISPIDDMKLCLSLQDHLLTHVQQKISDDEIKKIEPGAISFPSKTFWTYICGYFDSFDYKEFSSGDSESRYFIELGEFNIDQISENDFMERLFVGKLLPHYFIKFNGKFLPLLPRRFSSILIDTWAENFLKYKDVLSEGEITYHFRWSKSLFKYVKARCSLDKFFPFVSAVDEEGKPQECIFNMGFVVEDKLYLINLLNYMSDYQDEFARLSKLYKELTLLLEKNPTTLALHVDRSNVQFVSRDQVPLKVHYITLFPDFDIAVMPGAIPIGDIPGDVLGLHHFLAVIDELKSFNELNDFFDFLESNSGRTSGPFISPIDQFGAFKDSQGVLVSGANEPDMIMLDPHWGSHSRFRTLKDFWKIFPSKGYFDLPRSWKVVQVKDSVIRLQSREYFGALYLVVGPPEFSLTAPFDSMKYEQAQLANLHLECLSDLLLNNKEQLQRLKIFSIFEQFHFIFFPLSFIKNNDKFKHIHHLIKEDQNWIIDSQMLDEDTIGLRVVINDDLVKKAFLGVKDMSTELELLFAIIDALDQIQNDSKVEDVKSAIKNDSRDKKPHFRFYVDKRAVCFPHLSSFMKPTPTDFKLAHKRIAQIIKDLKINPGDYGLKQARDVLNIVRIEIVKDINKEISQFVFKSSIVRLIEMIDSVIDRLKSDRIMFQESMTLDVEYSRDTNYAKSTEKFISNHKNYRYLIEKFIQLQPQGNIQLSNDKMCYLLALIDVLHQIYEMSDMLHYGIGDLGIRISDDFLIDLRNTEEMELRHAEFGKEQARYNLGLKGNDKDDVKSPREFQKFVGNLDVAFKKDAKFSLTNMLAVCEILALWPNYCEGEKEDFYYSSNLEKLLKVIRPNIENVQDNEIKAIIAFLTLEHDQVLRITGQENLCDDLPVWEYLKRPNRYILKPLVFIDDQYFWGPHSILKAGDLWKIRIPMGTLPIKMEAPNVDACLQEEKRLIEEELERKSVEILKSITPYAENVSLHKRDKRGGHPEQLGDYDVLAYIESTSVVLNIECKDILPPFCLKDAHSLREKIFGKDNDKGYLGKIENRAGYLTGNLERVFEVMKWPKTDFKRIRVVSIYVSRHLYWWTMFPPYKTDVKFLTIDSLRDYLKSL